MLSAVVDLLMCPVCTAAFTLTGRTLVCGGGHSFDVARQGYVSVVGGTAAGLIADDAAMLDARARFQSAGHYDRIADEIARLVAAHAPADETTGSGAVAEIGAGTAFYLARVVDSASSVRRGIAVDLSKIAARRAARADERIGSLVADAWSTWPLGTGSLAAVLSVFGPRNVTELDRVLIDGGIAVVCTPQPTHLAELAEPLRLIGVQENKSERLRESMASRFTLVDHIDLSYPMPLRHSEIADVIGMGPSARHGDAERRATAISELPELMMVTAAVTIQTFKARGEASTDS